MNDMMKTLSGGTGLGADVRGPALVTAQGFGVRYDLDAASGVISNPDHDLYGETLSGRILVFNRPKGGVAASWALADLKQRGLAPLAIICRTASPIFVQGALFAGISLLHELSEDPYAMIQSGQHIAVYPRDGHVDILTRP